eukprot:TRINITY_DN3030_c4_g12_i1.p1 TRINITY_DN3030_c4_g12~~TRINITY_DN3030_c4_g12_i1.p1  ORF type:complete len:428 (-),score=108.57 TRINITY_DN3030_c4_g12_i1:41-1261(-)
MDSMERNEMIQRNVCDMTSYEIDESSVKEIEDVLFDSVYGCSYSPDGKYLVINGNNTFGRLYVFDAESIKSKFSLRDHVENVRNVVFSPNGQMLATCSEDNFIVIYRLPDFSILHRLCNSDEANLPSKIVEICFSMCSNHVYSTDYSGCLKKWDISTESVVLEKTLEKNNFWRLWCSPDGQHLLTSCVNYGVKLVDSENFAIHSLNYNGPTEAFDFHPTKKIVAIFDQFKQVNMWDMNDGSLLHTAKMDKRARALRFMTPTMMVLMYDDGNITSYNVDSFQEIQNVQSGCDGIWFSFAISPDKRQLACGKCVNNSIKVYSIVPQYDPSEKSQLIELSKDDGGVLSNLIALNLKTQDLRQMVAEGVCMNQKEYNMIVDTCWDLVDINESNGGNMHAFVNEQSDDDEE